MDLSDVAETEEVSGLNSHTMLIKLVFLQQNFSRISTGIVAGF